MKAVGLDTSVVLRLLVGEPENQAEAAKAFLEKCGLDGVAVCVNDLVVIEAYHALVYHYAVPKREAARTLLDFLSSPLVTATGQAAAALSGYTGTGAGLADRVIRMDFLKVVSEIVTFDADFSKLENVRRLPRVAGRFNARIRKRILPSRSDG